MKIAVVGANSYIARNLIFRLKQRRIDAELMLYDHADRQADGESAYHRIDVLDRKSVAEIDFDCDILYMFVGKTGTSDGFENYEEFIDINEKALLNILNEHRNQKSSAKIVFPSTRLVYKGSSRLLEEDDEKEFKTVYAINKYACEQCLKMFSRSFGVKYCVFRICVPYGSLLPGASSYGTIGFMLKKAQAGQNITLYGDGSARRTFTNIKDLCDILIDGALSENCLNDVYNIGGEDRSLKEVAEEIARKYGVGIDYIEYPSGQLKIESGDTVFCDDKLRRCLRDDLKKSPGGGYSYQVIMVALYDKLHRFIMEHYCLIQQNESGNMK